MVNTSSNSDSVNMKFYLVVAIVVVVTHATSIEEKWQEFKFNYGKTYKSYLEEKRRFVIFQDKVRRIEEHNAKYANGEVLYSVGINKFSDLTKEEFKGHLSKMNPKLQKEVVGTYNDTSLKADIQSVNWVSKGFVTPVKDQGSCGSCWAFSTIGAIEGQVAKSGSALVSLSAQNMVDCSSENYGCHGGDLAKAYEYVKEFGVLTESEYQYNGYDGTCRKRGGQKISGYVGIAQNEDALMSALASVGPVSAAMEADELDWYHAGIYDVSSYCTDKINHGVLIVGAGVENGVDYWLVKNSWGTNWGLEGYFKLIRGKNACGINLDNFYPQL